MDQAHVEMWEQSLPEWSLIRYASTLGTKARIVTWWGYKKTLTTRQQQILEKIASIRDVKLLPYDGDSPERIEADGDFLDEDWKEYDRLILKAWREGLGSHPLVFDRVDNYRAFGNREKLRCLEREYRHLKIGVESPISIADMTLLWVVDRLRSEGKSWPTIFRLVRDVGLLHRSSKELVELVKAIRQLLHEGRNWPDIVRETRALRNVLPAGSSRHKDSESLRAWMTVGSDDTQKRRDDIRHGYHYLYTKRLPLSLYNLVRSIAPPLSEIVRVEHLEEDEDYNVAVVVPDAMSLDELYALRIRLERVLAEYDYEAPTPKRYPVTLCNVWRKRDWENTAEQRQAEMKRVEDMVERGATLDEALKQLRPVWGSAPYSPSEETEW